MTRNKRNPNWPVEMFKRSKHPPKSFEDLRDPTLGETYTPSWGHFTPVPLLLGEDRQREPLRVSVNTDLSPEVVFRSRNFKATIRLVGPIGNGIFLPEDQKLRELLPEEPGEYWMDETGMHPVGLWPKGGGRIRRFFCKIGFHWKKRIQGYQWKVKQCPYCLKVRTGLGELVGMHAPEDAWDMYEMCLQFVKGYDRKFPLPRGGWVSIPLGDRVQYGSDGRSVSIDLSDL